MLPATLFPPDLAQRPVAATVAPFHSTTLYILTLAKVKCINGIRFSFCQPSVYLRIGHQLHVSKFNVFDTEQRPGVSTMHFRLSFPFNVAPDKNCVYFQVVANALVC